MRILHLSDTHITKGTGPNHNGTDSRDSLRWILSACERVPGVDLVLVTGDVADDGSPEAYSAAHDQIGGFAAERGIPAVYTTGNHDARAPFTEILGTGHPAPGCTFPGSERTAATTVGGYRVITLDSLVPGHDHGEISAAQLTWLRDVALAEPAPHGSILAFHHPPIAIAEVRVQHVLGLHNAAALAGAIRDTDVRLILCGHFHAQLFGMLAGIPVSATPGVINRIDDVTTPGGIHATRGASATLIDLGGPFEPLIHTVRARDPRLGETAYQVSL